MTTLGLGCRQKISKKPTVMPIASGNALDTTFTIHNTGLGPLDFEISVGGALPELMYYKFNEVGSNQTQNFAAPGSPVPVTANVLGLTMGGTGFEGAALIGNGGPSSSNYVDISGCDQR